MPFDETLPNPRQESTAPGFCARCQKRRNRELRLCSDCGDRVVDQGYCGICERYWLLGVGEFCPKHDCELEPPPPSLEARLGVTDRSMIVWSTVRSFVNAASLQAPRIRLEAEGIPTLVEGERTAASALGHGISNGMKLKVPSTLLDEARLILSQTWSAAHHEDDLETAWEDLEAAPGAKRLVVMKTVIVVFFGLLIARGLVGFLFGV